MKKVLPILCLIISLTLSQHHAFAQANQSFTFRNLWYNYVNPNPTVENWEDVFTDAKDHGVEAAYGRRLKAGTWLMIPAKIGAARYAKNGPNGMIANLDVLIQDNLASRKSLLNPSLFMGVGTTWDNRLKEFTFNIPAGVGLSVRLKPNFYLNAQTEYRFSFENRSGWQHGLGLVFLFGESDRDGDGISDKEDKCPDVAGLKALMGCPDRDGDGIADMADNCPDVAGLANLMGCPDRDGDGITDADDKCPDLMGLPATMGCPDRDGDGVIDSEDECPDVAGIAAMKGCPDADNDGITDIKDKCPREAGPASTMGCPDRDGDGVADKDDACPSKRGDSAHKGCPDTDGDGIYDDTDKCPDVPGIPSMNGCPAEKPKLERVVKLVQFESGKSVLVKKANATLDEVVTMMKDHKEYSLTINGHSDDLGNDKGNQALSERRTKACLDYLVSKGIAATRINSAGYGETKPTADNKTAEGRAQNRRAELELYVK